MASEVALGVLVPLAGGDLALSLHRFLLGLVQGLGLSSISFNFVLVVQFNSGLVLRFISGLVVVQDPA